MITTTGNTIAISAGPTVTVANVVSGTNKFRFLNANATGYTYVGVFSTYAAANVAQHPTTGQSAELVPLAPTESLEVVGNFGINPNPGTVYVAAITAGAAGQIVFATPCSN